MKKSKCRTCDVVVEKYDDMDTTKSIICGRCFFYSFLVSVVISMVMALTFVKHTL